jgi:hypothetical protein
LTDLGHLPEEGGRPVLGDFAAADDAVEDRATCVAPA